MELLKNIKYGRCFISNIVHNGCNYCCCECEMKSTCAMQCNPSTYLVDKKLCGNYQHIIDVNNENLLLMKRTQHTIRTMDKIRKERKVFNK